MSQLALRIAEPRKRKGGPGRTPTRKGTWVKHRARPWHDKNHPVHVTLKVRRGISNLRGHRVSKAIGEGLRLAATSGRDKKRARRETFRVVHFSIQPNHLHLIVEATSKTALARGMQGLASGLARRVNRELHRRGSLFADRYHAHALASPTEVRNAIVYVLKNFEKHPEPIPDRGTEPREGIDPSSGPIFSATCGSFPSLLPRGCHADPEWRPKASRARARPGDKDARSASSSGSWRARAAPARP
jgi:REP element-mobilizing transposase RayT